MTAVAEKIIVIIADFSTSRLSQRCHGISSNNVRVNACGNNAYSNNACDRYFRYTTVTVAGLM